MADPYFIGAELSAFEFPNGPPPVSTTNSYRADYEWNRYAWNIEDYPTLAKFDTPASGGVICAHWSMYGSFGSFLQMKHVLRGASGPGPNGEYFGLEDKDGDNSSLILTSYMSGSRVEVGSSFAVAASTAYVYDLMWDGTNIKCFVGGSEVATAVVDLGAHDISEFYQFVYWNQNYISSVAVAPYSLIGAVVGSIYADGDGTETDATGSYTDIDENKPDFADRVTSATATDRQSFSTTVKRPGGSTKAPAAVAVHGLAQRAGDTTGPTKGRPFVRDASSAAYMGAAVDVGYGVTSVLRCSENNPLTAAPWSDGDLADLQIGYEFVA